MTTLSLSYPFLFAIIPILFLYGRNGGQVSLEIIVIPIIVVLTATATVMTICRLLLGSAGKAAAVACLLVLLFFLYGHCFNLVWGLNLFTHSRHVHWLLIAFMGSLSAAATALVIRTTTDLRGLAAVAVGVASVMLLSSVVEIISAQGVESKAGSSAHANAPPFLRDDSADLPDVYYIILDGYARGDILQNTYGFDNSDFLSYLKSKGFYVAEQSVSNYPLTYMSLGSSLNLKYLDDAIDPSGKQVPEESIYDLIRTHLAGRYFKSKGYRYVHFNTNYGGTERSEIADITFAHSSPFLRSEFLAVLLRTTMLRVFEPSVADLHQFMFEQLKDVPGIQGPTFTLSHFLLPHNPYVFDRDGNVRNNIPLDLQWSEKTGGWLAKEEYIDQLIFLNRKVTEIVDALLTESAYPPIIIIQGDHGSATTLTTEHFESPESDAFVRERTAILNAYLVPEHVRERLYPTITPVNTFRLLFRHMFGGDFDQVSDRSYITWYGAPHRLTDVTQRVLPTPQRSDTSHAESGQPVVSTESEW